MMEPSVIVSYDNDIVTTKQKNQFKTESAYVVQLF
ncbi:uncharacterized protein METZ01_LOCUS22537 [marine metagenome]|jgi:hypothetical protein|uniref:Uncharacterized protein n=1 Tax=marine metagenome TaxID=408172 RepID=A0A381PW86_9ZZZZ